MSEIKCPACGSEIGPDDFGYLDGCQGPICDKCGRCGDSVDWQELTALRSRVEELEKENQRLSLFEELEALRQSNPVRITEDLLRLCDGALHISRGVSIVATGSLENLQRERDEARADAIGECAQIADDDADELLKRSEACGKLGTHDGNLDADYFDDAAQVLISHAKKVRALLPAPPAQKEGDNA